MGNKMAPIVELARLKAALDYDEHTGLFTWVKPRVGIKAGTKAGSRHNCGYVAICIDGRDYLAHRLAWFWHYGTWPIYLIDHIDGNRANNAIANLRDVPRIFNAHNVRRANRDSKTGFLGVTKIKRGFEAQIATRGVHYHLGVFKTPEQAHEAYIAAKRVLHPGFINADPIGQNGARNAHEP